ncbi:MAG: translocation/assembly module TamB domain-containing protein [Myxococcaceae bacterium]
MSRRLRRALLVLALGVVGLVCLLRTDRAGAYVCAQIQKEVPKRVPYAVKIGRCELEPLTQAVRLESVTVSEQNATEPMLTTDEAYVSLRSVLLTGVTLDQVRLVNPKVRLDLSAIPASGEKKKCPLDGLKAVRFEQLEVRNAAVQLTLSPTRKLDVEGLDLDWKTRRHTIELQAVLKGGRAVADGRKAALGKTLLDGSLDLDDESLTVQRGEVSVEGANLSAAGTITQLCDAMPVLDLNGQVFLPLTAVSRLAQKKELEPADGQLWAKWSVSGRADAPQGRAQLQASELKLGKFKPGDFTAALSFNPERLNLDSFETRSGEGWVKVSGEVKLSGKLPVKFKIETEDASFARIADRASISGAWVEFPASVRGTVSGTLLPSPAITGPIEAHLGHFVVGTHAWDAPGQNILTFQRSQARFKLGVYGDRVEFTDIVASAGVKDATQLKGAVVLHTDQKVGLNIDVTADNLELSDFGSIADIPWSGAGTAQVSIHGPYSAVEIDGKVALHDFEFAHYAGGQLGGPVKLRGTTLSFPQLQGQRGRTPYVGYAELRFLKDDLHVSAQAQLAQGRTEDLIDLMAKLSPTIAALQGPLTGDASGNVRFEGPAKTIDGWINVKLDDTRYFGRNFGSGEVAVRLEKLESLVLDPTVLKGPVGTTYAAGRWHLSGPLDYDVRIEGGSVSEAIGAFAVEHGIDGVFSLGARVTGTSELPQIQGYLNTPDVKYAHQSIGTSQLQAKLTGKEMEIWGTVFPGVRGNGTISWNNQYPYTTSLTLDVGDMRPFLPVSAVRQGLSGGLKGELRASGNLLAFDGSKVSSELSSLRVARGDLWVQNEGTVVLGYDNGRIDVPAFHVKGPTTELSAEGFYGPTNVDLKAQGRLDLRLAESFVPDLERTGGELEMSGVITGTVKQPLLVGSGDVRDAKFSVKGQQMAIRALSGHAEFSQQRVLLEDFEGFANDGRVKGTGDLQLGSGGLKNVQIEIYPDEVTYIPRADLPATVTGHLLFSGQAPKGQSWPDVYQLQGDLNVVKMHYTTPLDLESFLQTRVALPPSDEKPNEWLSLNVDIDCNGGDIRLDNNLARGPVSGKLTLVGTNLAPQLKGTLTAGEGAQAFFRSSTFNVNHGSLQFNRADPATVDFSAVAQVREYTVNVKAFGRLSEPKVSLTSTPSLPENDILSLLTLGVTSREKVASEAGAGLAAEALLSATGLQREVQRFLKKGDAVVIKDQQVHLSTTFNEATGQAEPSVQWEAKVISDKVGVKVTYPVTGRGRKVEAQYHINDRASVKAQWDDQSENSSVGNPGVDLKFKFQWE